MSVFFRSRPAESRSLSYQDVWGSGSVSSAIGGPGIVAGGLRLIPVYAATALIADLVSTAPLSAFSEAPDGARTLLKVQPDLIVKPAPYGSRVDWVQQAMTSLLLRGNAYGYITALDSRGVPSRIAWLNPDEVTVIEEQNDWFHRPSYFWRGRPLDFSLVVHITGYTFPGSVVGYSPLGLFKKQIETGLRAQDKAEEWFKNGTVPSGKLKNTARRINPTEAGVVKDRFKRAMKSGDVFVSGADWDYETLAVKADEALFLETIKATANQVAAMYRVSPEDVGGETGTSLTYKTLEQDQTRLTVRTLGVWCVRFQEHLTALLPDGEDARFNLDRMSQGDKTSRMLAHAAALNAGLETQDEARAEEDKPPLTPDQIQQWQDYYRKTTGTLAEPKPSAGPSGGPDA
jgi:HK97 family phage portal protein